MKEVTSKTTSSPHQCRHCGNKGLLKILSEHTDEADDPSSGDTTWQTWSLAKCPVCAGISLLHCSGTDHLVESIVEDGRDPEEELTEIVFPSAANHPKGLPTEISDALTAAEKVKMIDANAYAVLQGRVLECVCTDQSASGNSLFERIEDLETKGTIPSSLVGVAHGLRKLRNTGAHPDLGNLSASEFSLLADLCQAVLAVVYTAPYLSRVAEERAGELQLKPRDLVKAEELVEFVARHYGLKVSEIKSRNNAKQIAFPRQIAMYLCKQLTDLSFPDIGKHFNNKHHSTVMYSVDKIEKLRAEDSDLDQTLHSISQHFS